MSTPTTFDVRDEANTVLVNKIIRYAVSQAPGDEIESRTITKVRADQVRSGDIELTSRKHLDQNLVVDRMEEYSDIAVLIFYVGHDSPREVMRDRRLTVAR